MKHRRGRYHAGVCVPPVLSLLGLGLLVSSRHLGFVGRLAGGADLDGRVLERGGRDGDFAPALREDTRMLTDMFRYSFRSLD